MGYWMIWGNVVMAKLFQTLFSTPRLSDVGSTFRLLHRRVVDALTRTMSVTGNFYDVELMFLTWAHGFKFLEIPVHYQERVGQSSVTGYWHKTFHLAAIMFMLIVKFRLQTLLPGGRARFTSRASGAAA